MPITIDQFDDDTITAFRDEDGVDDTTVALCNKALGHLSTEREIDEAIASLQEGEDWWFRSLTRTEARAEVLARLNAARAREIAQEALDDAANRRAGEARDEEAQAQKGAIDRSFHGIDLTCWLRVLAAAMAGAKAVR